MPYIVITNSGELYHHGILGQKWGQRNGPPYPLGSGDHSAREEKAGWEKSLKNKSSSGSKSSNNTDTKSISKFLNVDEEQAEKLKKAAIILGITAGTAAGMVALGYLASNTDVLDKLVATPNSYLQLIGPDYNLSGSFGKYKLDAINQSRKNGSLIGNLAMSKGYGMVDGDFIHDAITNPITDKARNLDDVIKDMRINVMDDSGGRRLSCWSGSHAYFLSALTGHDFTSRSYQNLVDFNDFGRLYKEPQEIFDIWGNEARNFVGKFGDGFGKDFKRANNWDTDRLLRGIATNITKAANLTPDGSRSIGFIDAGYGGTTCTHQWNFEVEHLPGNLKRIIMADSYVGSRYPVAELQGGNLLHLSGFDNFEKELHHYNSESIRYYAPSLDDLNLEAISNVVLGSSIKHSSSGEKSMGYIIIGYSDELYHHGILGQKWGKRQGPPYPLDANDHSAREKKMGWAKSLNDKSSTKLKKKAIKAVYKDMDEHFRSGISKEANKVTSLHYNGYDSRGASWTKAYSKGKVTNKDAQDIKKSAKESREYIKTKYGEEVYKTMSRSGELFSSKWVESNNVNWESLSKKLRGIDDVSISSIIEARPKPFGYTDVLKARKAYNKSSKDNYKKMISSSNKSTFEKSHPNGTTSDVKKLRQTQYRDAVEREYSKLLDAGYDEASAKNAAEWLVSKGIRL